MNQEKKLRFATIAVHGKNRLEKHDPPPPVRALSPPIYQSSTFSFESAEHGAACFAGEVDGYIYTRLGNPTHRALEMEVAYLEGGEDAVAFASGMAATMTLVLSLARPGDNIVSGDTLYGGTHALFRNRLPEMGIEARQIDTCVAENVAKTADEKTKLVFLETPANPTLRMTDISAVAKICHERGIPLVVDNTFPTPYYQNPLALGADLALHSATKYIGGHGDTVAGIVVGKKDVIHEIRNEFLADFGGVISPFNAWLLLRGLKTLPVRMDRHTENATEIAQFLSYHPKVEQVIYPGLRTHPQYELGRRQMSGAGGMVSLIVKGGRDAGRIVMNSVELITLAVSLGDVDSLIQHPASMTHSTYSSEELASAGIHEGLIRISVGLEDVEDIEADLRQALSRIP